MGGVKKTTTQMARVHADRVHTCGRCGKRCRGNGGRSSHKAWHQRRDLAAMDDLECVKYGCAKRAVVLERHDGLESPLCEDHETREHDRVIRRLWAEK